MKKKTILTVVSLIFLFFITDIHAKIKTKKLKLSTAGKVYVAKEVEGFKLENTEKYEDIELGVSISYKNNNVPAGLTYYIYPVSDQVSIEFAMANEYDNIIADIKSVAEKDGGIFSVLDVKIMNVNNHNVIKTTMHMELQNQIYISELYLTSSKNHFIKLRASYPMSVSKKLGLRKLFNTVFEKMFLSTKFKSKKESERSIAMDVNNLDPNDKSRFQLALFYGVNVMAQVPEDLMLNFSNYLKIYELTLSTVGESNRDSSNIDKKNDTIIGFQDINEVGYLKEFIWTVFYSPYWEKPNDLQLDEFNEWTKQHKSKTFQGRPLGVDVLISRD